MIAKWEEARKEDTAFRAERDCPLPERTFMSDRGVFRTISPLAGWEDMSKRRQFFQQVSSPSPFVSDLNEARDHTDTSIYRPRRELGYRPDNPRISPGEGGFIHEIRG